MNRISIIAKVFLILAGILISLSLYAQDNVDTSNVLKSDEAISNVEIISPCYRNNIYTSMLPLKIKARFRCNLDETKMSGIRYSVALDDNMPAEWLQIKNENILEAAIDKSIKSNSIITLNIYFKDLPGIKKKSAVLKVIPPAQKGNEVIIGDNNEIILNGKPFFPAGFYSIAQGDENTPIAKAGYNLVVGVKIHSLNEWLDNCQAAGLYGIVRLPKKFAVDKDENAIREFIRNIKDHPALFGYYLFDEPSPEKQYQTPEKIKPVYDIVADEDPYHPMVICINHEDFIVQYLECLDILLTDFYPVLNKKTLFDGFSDEIKKSIIDVNGMKPFWPVIQSFGEDTIQGMDKKSINITPTPDQIRFMTYLCLMNRINGIMFFSYHVFNQRVPVNKNPGKYTYELGGYLPEEQPALWGALVELSPEIKLIGNNLIKNNNKFGISKSIIWMKTLHDNGDALFVGVNSNGSVDTNLDLSGEFSDLIRINILYGNASVKEVDGRNILVMPPMGTFVAEIIYDETKQVKKEME